MKRPFFLLLFYCFCVGATAQNNSARAPLSTDSLKQLSQQEFFNLILQGHPVAKQAALLRDEAKAELRMARGNFDPKLVGDFARKEFKGTDYYNNFNGYLSVPTWAGVDFKAGYERNVGSFVNAENTVPNAGLLYLGASLPIGQGLFIDQRRATLRQAQIFQNINEAERIKAINKLLLSAAKDYWDWFYTYQELQFTLNGLRFADERYRAIVTRFKTGESAAIDTTEALITYQDRQIQVAQAEVAYNNARLQLSTYLWDAEQRPLEIQQALIPVAPADNQVPPQAELNRLLNFAETYHPELLKIMGKGQQLAIERRLARENLKPIINLNYNLLDSYGGGTFNEANTFSNNYKMGAYVAFPIFLRKERGKLALTNVKINTNELDRIQLNRDIQNGVRANWNSLLTFQSLLSQQRAMVVNYQTLRDAEIDKFTLGESSLFLINAREAKLIESQIKQADILRKYLKAKAELNWAAGTTEWWANP